ALLERLLTHPYLQQSPPKSCGREEFNLDWLKSCLEGSDSAQDIQATLVEFSARSVAEAILTHCGAPDTVLACGGGARNPQLMAALAQHLSNTTVTTTDTAGLDADSLEATAFAWLAQRTMHGLPGNLPEVTGASGERILGAIYPA